MKNIFSTLTINFYKLIFALGISALIWIPYFTTLNHYRVEPFNSEFIAIVLVYLVTIGTIFNSVSTIILTASFLYLISILYLSSVNYSEILFWRMRFVTDISEKLFSNILIGTILSLLLFLLIRFMKLKIVFIESLLKRIPYRPISLLLGTLLLLLTLISPFLIVFNQDINPINLYGAIQSRQISTKTDKILRVSPEQSLDYYFTSLEKGDYENAYFAQIPGSIADDTGYFDFIDRVKEEDIQLTQPLSHTVETGSIHGTNTENPDYLVIVTRKNKSVQEYSVTMKRDSDKWYLKEIVLSKMQ